MPRVMQYDLSFPNRVVFGWGRRAEIGALAVALGRRAFLVAGSRTLERNGTIGAIIDSLRQRRVADRGDDRPLDDFVGQQLLGQQGGMRLVELALDQIAATGGDRKLLAETQIGRRSGHVVGDPVRLAGRRIDINFPQSHVYFSLL